MIRFCFPASACLLGLIIGAGPTSLCAQPAAAPAAPAATPPAAAPSLQIVIPDEPRHIGTEGLLPPALTKAVTVEFDGRPLADVVGWLRDDQKLSIIVDKPLRSELATAVVTDRLADEPLELLLNRLETVNVGWYLDKGVLHLGRQNEASSHHIQVQYNLAPLLDAGFEADRLIETVRKGTSGPWSGETPATSGTAILVGDVLFVKQNQRTQTEVAALLAALAKHGRRTLLLDPPQHTALRKTLTQPISINLDEVPLGTAIRQVAAKLQVPLRIDPRVGKVLNLEREPVTLVAEDEDLATILSRMSKTALAPEIRYGALWVTPRNMEADRSLTAVYDVRDLCLDFAESAALDLAIRNQIPGQWLLANSNIGVIGFPRPGILVVRQKLPQLDAVEELLEDYRDALRVSKPRPQARAGLQKLELRIYRVPTEMAEDAESILRDLVAPTSWQSAVPDQPGTIRRANAPSELKVLEGGVARPQADKPGAPGVALRPYSVLLIRQTVENHQEIARLLRRLEQGDPPAPATSLERKGPSGFGRGFFEQPR